MGKKKKPLLAEQGIVHLKHSFVQPTEESGLLKTVGGEIDRTALILATGTYGYAIPISTITKETDDNIAPEIEVIDELECISDDEKEEPAQAPVPADKQQGTSKKGESGSKRKAPEKKKEINPDELSVAELVRVIGGGSGAPLRRCDVVDDREKKNDDKEEEETEEIPEEDPEADEFYESLGIQKTKKRKLNDEDGEEKEESKAAGEVEEASKQAPPEDAPMLQDISDYYKDNANSIYYYSQQQNPYGQHRLEFGPYIEAEESMDYDQDYIQLARLAQRARAAAQAAALRQAKAKETDSNDENKEEPIYDPLPMEQVASTKPEDLGITVDTNLEQYWHFVKEDPHDFDRWVYLIQYVENTVST